MRNIFDLLKSGRARARQEEIISAPEMPPHQKARIAEAEGNFELAIENYRQAIGQRPQNAAARAGLGRLTFKPPEQPFVSEFKRKTPGKIVEVHVEVRNPCNYRCSYCVAADLNNQKVQRFDLSAVEQTLQVIEADLITIALDCGGGEPAVHPQFPELLALLTRFGPVSFPTNNSQNPERWLPKETASRLLVRSALHPESEEKLSHYIANARKLIDAGCNFLGIFICHPDRLHKVQEYKAIFAENDIPFTCTNFLGEHEGKRYPHSYTDEERALLDLPEEGYFRHMLISEPEMTRIRNFSGVPCHAGSGHVYIRNTGAMQRCYYDARPIEKPMAGPDICQVRNCGCGMMLAGLAAFEMPDYYNYWAPLSGLDPRRS